MRTIRIFLFAAVAATGCTGQADVQYSGQVAVAPVTVDAAAYAAPPDLVAVDSAPGVQVVADFGEPVFYTNNVYWRFSGGTWYSSPTWGGGGWVSARPPVFAAQIDTRAYVHYRPTGWVAPAQRTPEYRGPGTVNVSARVYGNGPTVQEHTYSNGPTVQEHTYSNGPTVQEHTYSNGPTVQEHTVTNGPTVQEHTYSNGPTVQEHTTPSGPTVQEHTYSNGPTVQEHTTPSGPTVQEHTYSNTPAVSEHTKPSGPTVQAHTQPASKPAQKAPPPKKKNYK